jgi:lipid-binding SYLF domain-containing protein
MNLRNLLTIGTVMLSFAAGNALAQDDKAKKQAEIKKVTQATLQKFYKAKPELKGEVEKAPGYAVFTTYGLSFVIGGGGGKGVAHDNKTNKDTFMHLAQASAGAQVGIAESETLFVFGTQKALDDFVNKGWEASGGGAIQGGVAGKSAGTASGGTNQALTYYTLTRNGLQLGVAVGETKVWKDKDLN